ncbi:MAG: hypothetical protein ACRERE_39705 [Candidatus Entotheonellia bacterium]
MTPEIAGNCRTGVRIEAGTPVPKRSHHTLLRRRHGGERNVERQWQLVRRPWVADAIVLLRVAGWAERDRAVRRRY